MSKKASKEKVLIGWSEYMDFPDWGIKHLHAKIDTGARTSALDVDHIEMLPHHRVRFNIVLTKRAKKRITHIVTADISRISYVKSSPIHKEKRIFVKTLIKLGPIAKEIEINLVDRSNMVYRMLLGRSALKSDFLVDVEHASLLSSEKKKVTVKKKRTA